MQRVTAVALVPLGLWFFVSMLSISATSYVAVRTWMTRPFNTVLLAAFVLVAAYHSYLGLREVLEDYVHQPGMRIAMGLLVRFVYTLAATGAVLAVCVVAFGGLV